MISSFRIESDSLGEMRVPRDASYGIHTALENFPITDVQLSHFPELVQALAMVKRAAALANGDFGVLAPELAGPIDTVCDEIIHGQHHEHFVVDLIQGGAGTSTNMNANEVIANLALRKLGHAYDDYEHLHPNDHVNRSQSTNDVYPTAIRLATLQKCEPLCIEQRRLGLAFAVRAAAFSDIIKVGRTQLQDAVPITLGMEFASFAATIDEDVERIEQLDELLKELNLGGTAVGTGVNTPPGYAALAVKYLSEISGNKLIEARDRVEASSDPGALITFSEVLKCIAVKVSKICNDLRLLSSGPRGGFGEIRLPAVQAGSSIMPGKVNPIIPEVVDQVAYRVIGNDLTVTMAAEAGQLQLNAMEPVVIFNVLESMRILTRSLTVLTDRCVSGIEADVARCDELLRGSFVLATALVPLIGYEKAAAMAKTARVTGRTIGETALEFGVMTHEEIERALNPQSILGPIAGRMR